MLLAFAWRWALLFAALLALTSPFRYRVLPAPGPWLRPTLETSLTALNGQSTALYSDSPGLWLWAGLLLLATALLAALWTRLSHSRPAADARLWYGLHTGAAWFVALHLLEYGFDKVFKVQFYLPEPNTLYTPLGQLAPDLAYWSVMGTSHFYSLFAGLLEVGPGLLLLWGRTRALGAVLAVAVLLQVLALNIGFDISVKLWSGFLLGLAGLVAAPALRSLYAGLVLERWQPARVPRPAGWGGRGVGALRGLLLAGLLLETAGPYLQTGIFNDDAAARPFLHGAYALQAESLAGRGLRRLFIHRRGYLITEDSAGRFRDYPLRYAPGRLLLGPRPDTLRFQRAGRSLRLRGRIGPDAGRWRCRGGNCRCCRAVNNGAGIIRGRKGRPGRVGRAAGAECGRPRQPRPAPPASASRPLSAGGKAGCLAGAPGAGLVLATGAPPTAHSVSGRRCPGATIARYS
ncbi:hypothetical protein Q5H93_22310 [Hymenobacter sp. ASUV-10]|uniref:DoxX family membrane protein n=1 Tax=Hymenobacter aranciens TaxID=3063996 RepID=A0ABT9BGV1_9BACT|nr:hypothetical protein [Hymenobacter sp. ASUV-10]MDO7877489.1 hypothetical protein [Hymenobacter sp. ASUV-10]